MIIVECELDFIILCPTRRHHFYVALDLALPQFFPVADQGHGRPDVVSFRRWIGFSISSQNDREEVAVNLDRHLHHRAL